MTEEEWLTGRDGRALYESLRDEQASFRTRWLGWIGVRRFQVSERKLRLFCCACCYRIFDLIPTEESRRCVAAAEDLADGLISEAAMEEAVRASMAACAFWHRRRQSEHDPFGHSVREAINAVSRVFRTDEQGRSGSIRAAAAARAGDAVQRVLANQNTESLRDILVEQYVSERHPVVAEAFQAESAIQADLLRDIVGNPFRSVHIDPAWLTWHHSVVFHMARSIYVDKRFGELPILADALEDAGCTSTDILTHCRSGTEHVRGCWVVDALLGASPAAPSPA
jgi:hypothetical protein